MRRASKASAACCGIVGVTWAAHARADGSRAGGSGGPLLVRRGRLLPQSKRSTLERHVLGLDSRCDGNPSTTRRRREPHPPGGDCDGSVGGSAQGFAVHNVCTCGSIRRSRQTMGAFTVRPARLPAGGWELSSPKCTSCTGPLVDGSMMVHFVGSDAVSVESTVRPARSRTPLFRAGRVDPERVVRGCPPTSAKVVEHESGSS
jgi:hypothetical protein